MKKWLNALLMASSLTGCVVYPTERVYLQPIIHTATSNTAASELVASQSCGYHAAKYDGLKQTLSDSTMTVYPSYVEDESLSFTLVARSSVADSADALQMKENIRVVINDDKSSVYPFAVVQIFERRQGEVISRWYKAEIEVPAKNVRSLGIYVKPFMQMDTSGAEPPEIEFNFEKATVSDIYYGSINC